MTAQIARFAQSLVGTDMVYNFARDQATSFAYSAGEKLAKGAFNRAFQLELLTSLALEGKFIPSLTDIALAVYHSDTPYAGVGSYYGKSIGKAILPMPFAELTGGILGPMILQKFDTAHKTNAPAVRALILGHKATQLTGSYGIGLAVGASTFGVGNSGGTSPPVVSAQPQPPSVLSWVGSTVFNKSLEQVKRLIPSYRDIPIPVGTPPSPIDTFTSGRNSPVIANATVASISPTASTPRETLPRASRASTPTVASRASTPTVIIQEDIPAVVGRGRINPKSENPQPNNTISSNSGPYRRSLFNTRGRTLTQNNDRNIDYRNIDYINNTTTDTIFYDPNSQPISEPISSANSSVRTTPDKRENMRGGEVNRRGGEVNRRGGEVNMRGGEVNMGDTVMRSLDFTPPTEGYI